MGNESTAELLAQITIEVLLDELNRRAVIAGMTVEDLVRETKASIQSGRDENTAGRQAGHETEL
jgi:hypothetical protein